MYLLRDYALQFVGLNYKWGGDDSIEGMDCSGFLQVLLASCGEDPRGDQTAQGLFDWFSNGRGEWNRYVCGAIAWFGKDPAHITHVSMLLDQYRMIHAAGGGSETQTKKDSAKDNAYVKIEVITTRKDLVAVIKPYYRKIGII